MRKVKVVPHNLEWQNLFKQESEFLGRALGKNVVAINHIGSTAIPNIDAKPIIDILIEVNDIKEVDCSVGNMERLGYRAMGEFGIIGRRYFRKHDSFGIRTHHVHLFQSGSSQIKRHIAFRDYMISHPVEAQQYSELKQKLAKQFPTDIESYMDGKDEFIKNIDRKARQLYDI